MIDRADLQPGDLAKRKRGNPCQPVKDRLLARIVKTDAGCWEWQGALCKVTGYGHISRLGENIGAHVASYLEFKGEIPAGQCVLHACDNRPCINPEHLFLGTKADNTADAKIKRRFKLHVFKPGENIKKLNQRTADIIRWMQRSGWKASELAEIYGVSKTSVHGVMQGLSYVG